MEDVGRGPVGIDTAIFVYYVEEHPTYVGLVSPLFEALDESRCQAVTSALTLLETLVVPYREGNPAIAERYEILLSRSRGLKLVELDHALLRVAARLRADYGVKTPDSIQLAAAVSKGCTTFVTHDRPLSKVQGIRILQIGRYVPAQ
jgi:predicted nucleic acid-binding protein